MLSHTVSHCIVDVSVSHQDGARCASAVVKDLDVTRQLRCV